MTVTLADAITEVRRELAIRKSCYPRWIASNRLSQANADHQFAAMALVLENLLDIADLIEHHDDSSSHSFESARDQLQRIRAKLVSRSAAQIEMGFTAQTPG